MRGNLTVTPRLSVGVLFAYSKAYSRGHPALVSGSLLETVSIFVYLCILVIGIEMQKLNTYNKHCGNFGEYIAFKHLSANGYSIIERNFKYGKRGEIDIIAEREGVLVFIEVKTRTTVNFGSAIEQISPNKILRWREAAEGYMFLHQITNKECRLDLIAIDIADGNYKITHIENVG